MNHCVPDFEMEEYYPAPPKRPSISMAPEDGIMELFWENGHVVMQSQKHQASPTPTFKFHGAAQSAPREIRPSSLSQQPDHLFMQEDEMASWLHYPLNNQDFTADLVYPSAAASVPPLPRVNQVPAPATASASRPLMPPPRSNELGSARLQNFVHFSRQRTARTEQSQPSNLKSVVKEPTVPDSRHSPTMAPESGAPQAMPSNTETESGGNNNDASANMGAAAVANTRSAGVSTGANKDNLATCEVKVTSPPDGYSARDEPTAQKAAPAEDRKRKGREPDEAECQSEDAEFESVDTKKKPRGSTSTKRSRTAEVHNLSERRRRDRINEKMKALQELIPRCNKSDKASMLDEAIEYLKSLQLQVQMMTMSCGMVPMMFPGIQQYMPTMGMGMGMGMGMDMGISRPMMPFPNVLDGSGVPTSTAAVHLGPRFPMPAFHMPQPAQPNTRPEAMLNPLSIPNQPRVPNLAGPDQQHLSLQQMQIVPPQSQATAHPSSSKPGTSPAENLENHQSGPKYKFVICYTVLKEDLAFSCSSLEAPRSLCVADMVSVHGDWDWERLGALLSREKLELITSVQPPRSDASLDRSGWRWETKRTFSVRSAYGYLVHGLEFGNGDTWKRVWKLAVPQRVRVFIWLTFHNRLLTNVERVRRHVATSELCEICNNGQEDVEHVLGRVQWPRGVDESVAT